MRAQRNLRYSPPPLAPPPLFRVCPSRHPDGLLACLSGEGQTKLTRKWTSEMPGAQRNTHPVWRREPAVRVWGPPSGRLSGLGAPPGLASVGWCSGGPPSFCPFSFSLFFFSLFLPLPPFLSFLFSPQLLSSKAAREPYLPKYPPCFGAALPPEGAQGAEGGHKEKKRKRKNEKRSHLFRPSELFNNFIHIKAILSLNGAVF